MASRLSLVASILLNPASRDKRVKGFKKQLAPLPWYTAQQAESVAKQQRLARESSNQLDASSDPLLQILKQKDMKMKRTLSQFLSEDDTESVSDAKKSRTTSTSSPELLTPTTPPSSSPRISSRAVSPPPEADAQADPPPPDQKIASGRYKLDDDPDIEPREYELIIMEAKLNRSNYSDNFAETDLQTPDSSVSEKACNPEGTELSLDKTGDSEVREKAEVSDSTETVSNGKDECSELTDASVTLTEQELEEVTRHQFMLSYQSMCHVLGVSQEEGDKVLKSWQNSKDKPSGILKTPTEKFGTRPENSISDSLLPPQEKIVSFCLPTPQESISPPVPAPTSDPLSLPPPQTQEPTTPVLATLSPPQGGLMSTPVPSAPQAGTLTSAALSAPPPLPQDISIIASGTPLPNIFPLSSTSLAFSLTTQANTSMVPSTIRSEVVPPIQTQQPPSLLSKPTSNPAILSDSNKQPLATPLPEPPQSETRSNSPFAFLAKVKPTAATTQPQSLLTSQTITPSSQTKLQSSNNLFRLPNPPSQPQVPNQVSLFQTTSTPIQRGVAPQTPQSIPFKNPNPSLFNNPQEKPAKSFHNLEITYSIPPNSGSLFPPPPSTQTAQPFSVPNESPVPNLFKRQHAIAFNSPEPSPSSLPSNPISSLQLSSATKPSNNFAFQPTADIQGTAFAPKVPFSFNFGQNATQNSLFQGAGATPPPPFEGAYGNTASRRFPIRSSKKKRK